VSDMLCPYQLWACPIPGHALSAGSSKYEFDVGELVRTGFECVDLRGDLESCGGCGSLDQAHDCTSIPHARGVACVHAQCAVDSCAPGYKVSSAGNTCVRG
ncbi:hypothetical protein FA95DRAFT_1500810, partial [Auriscalpium vulgare]